MKKRKLKILPFIILLVVLAIITIVSIFIIYKVNISKVSNKSEVITFTVEENQTFSTLATELKEANLIKSEFFYKVYIKLNNPGSIQKGIYQLNKNMSVKEITDILADKPNYNNDINLTFKEGLNMREIISIITKNTDITEAEILNKLSDKKYLDTLITNYWFLTADIKNENIYYSLEGYLFPDTYQFNKDVDIETIFKTMLDNTEKKIDNYKTSIKNNSYTYHQLLTLASIVELESVGDDRAGVAGVFYNRLNNNWSLGSDVTTYYAAKVDMNERDLYQTELDSINAYNTRSSSMAGKLPVGPICNPGIDAIEAVINPTKSNYFYFVADKNKKTYYSTTYNQHLSTIAKLKSEKLWYEY